MSADKIDRSLGELDGAKEPVDHLGVGEHPGLHMGVCRSKVVFWLQKKNNHFCFCKGSAPSPPPRAFQYFV